MPIPGSEEFGQCVRELVFGPSHKVLSAGRARTAHTPGGTGALRVAAEFLRRTSPDATVHLSDPTWANHKNIFSAAGLTLASYPYYDAETHGLDFEAMASALGEVPAGDVVVLHACCHNPTGVDPSAEQWQRIASIAAERGFLPLFDFAYQGFGEGLEADAVGVRAVAEKVDEMLLASSFSKNFGLYRERTGGMTLIAASPEQADGAFTHVKAAIRSNYSNPPAHGGAIVTTVLTDAPLRDQWEGEVAQMRERIHEMRRLFVQTLKDKGVQRDFSFIERQSGMFSFSGLTREQVDRLREEYSIYVVGSGRINVAGMTAENMDRLCEALAKVL
jgi:aspartate aminotransferase/aromatic-amino-acid transaminase